MEFTAKLNYVRVSPQKARLVLDLIKGRRVEEALDTLLYTKKGIAPQIYKLLRSAVENANYVSAEKNLDIDLYFFISGPAHMPKDVVAKIHQETVAIMALPDVRESLLKQGLVPATAGPDELGSLIKADIERWKQFIASAKITAD